nr:hypothetical protein [Bacillus velezensis]
MCGPGIKNGKALFVLRQNRSVYLYNDAMKDSLARFKFRGDAKIIQAFERDFAAGFKAAYPSNTHTLIPIPLSGERLAERGFNQSEFAGLSARNARHFPPHPTEQ